MSQTLTESAVRAEVDAVNRRFTEAVTRGDAAGMAAVYTEDAVALPPDGPMITGRDRIEEFWGGLLKAGLRDVGLETMRLAGSDEIMHEVGRATITIQPEGGETGTDTAKYVVVWERQPGGSWAWAVDIWNGEPTG